MSTTETSQPGRSSSGSTTSQVSEELSNDASRLTDTAKSRAEQEASSRKEEATRVAKSASSALDKAASELEKDKNAPSWLASAVRQGAGQIDRLASEVEGKSVQEIGQQVNSFARQNPGTFLAASAAAGFAAARFLCAGSEYKSHHSSSGSSSTSAMGASSISTSSTGSMSTSTTGATSTTGGTSSRPAIGGHAARVEPPIRQGGPTI